MLVSSDERPNQVYDSSCRVLNDADDGPIYDTSMIHSLVSSEPHLTLRSLPALQVQDTSFILCIVYMQPEIPVKQLKNLNTAPSSKLLYHRLDLLGQPSSCLHFKQLATVGKTCKPTAARSGSVLNLGRDEGRVFIFIFLARPFLLHLQPLM